MSLEPLVLDDLDWAVMLEAIRRRIPVESDGVWTLHSPVDPGVTLLELFAHLLEQRLYWLDQVPDTLVLAVQRLLGVDDPHPAAVAGTVLRLRAGQPGEPPPLVPAGTVLARDAQDRVAFTLSMPTTVLAVDPPDIRIWTDGQERTAALAAGSPVPLFGSTSEVRLLLPVTDAPPAAPAAPAAGAGLSLLMELAAPAKVRPQWHPEAVTVAPPAALTWSWYLPDAADPSIGTDLPPIAAEAMSDGTGGLRRSGVVHVPLPGEWCSPATNSGQKAYGLRIAGDVSRWTTAPRLLGLVPDAVLAEHRRRLVVTGADVVDQTRAWLRLPGQRLILPGAQGILLGANVTITRDGEEQSWKSVADLTASGPDHRVFLLDRAAGAVVFGDGLTGAIPVPDQDGEGRSLLNVEYDVGGGDDGNGGLTSTWTTIPGAGPSFPVSAENVVTAEGGAEPETIAGLRTRIGDSLAEPTRAVTAADHVELALTTPGVAIARCYVGPGEHPQHPCTTVPGAVTVRVVPDVWDAEAHLADAGYRPALVPDAGAVAAVAQRLAPARLLGSELWLRPPVYVPVMLRVEVSGVPADLAGARDLVRAALRRHLDPLLGGDDGAGWPFGEPLRPSGLLRVVQDALGDRALVEQVAIGLDGSAPSGGCADVPIGPGRLPSLQQVSVVSLAVTAARTTEGGGAS